MVRGALKWVYRTVFARRQFERFNRFVFELSLNGLGILNWENSKLSGEDHFLQKFLKGRGSPVVLDVGANVGHYAMKVRELAPTSRVYAFEAHPSAFRTLLENGNKYGFRAFNVACGSENGESSLFDYDGASGSEHASVYREVIEQIHRSASQKFEVKAAKLDDLVNQLEISAIDLAKVDVEGAELDVLLGFQRCLREGRVAAVQFEFNEMNVVSRIFFRDFVKLLDGFDLYRMLPSGLLPIQYSPLACELFAYQNIVAIRQK
jgi:FkbM family methyltransferase